MSNIKQIIAQNLIELRKRKKYTQADLANILQYSDKTISKWEKGDSLPDIEVLYEICNLYNVTLDYLTHEGSYEDKKDYVISNNNNRNKIIIVSLITSLIVLIAVIIFTYSIMYTKIILWPIFIWMFTPIFIILLVFNSIWGRKKWKFMIVSFLTWSSLAGIHLQSVFMNTNMWPVYLIGIPLQIAIILWSQLKRG